MTITSPTSHPPIFRSHGTFDDNLSFLHARDLGHERGFLLQVGRTGDHMADAQLHRFQAPGADHGPLAAVGAGVHHSLQVSEHKNVTRGADLGACVDISENDDVAVVRDALACSQGAADIERSVRN
jgi:hypothetical protein